MRIEDLIKIRIELSKAKFRPPVKPKEFAKEKFVIPTPDKGEAEADYVNRCMAAIGSEYDTQEQALAVCYAQLK
jgi:hypothetical protein